VVAVIRSLRLFYFITTLVVCSCFDVCWCFGVAGWGAMRVADLQGGKKNLVTARVSMLLKSRASLTCFPACFLSGRDKDLSVPRY